MFGTIFSFEFKRWIKGWQFYLYALIFFFLGLFTMGSSIGFFDNFVVTSTSLTKMNSPLMISVLLEGLNRLLYFLFPTIIGAAIYRDYKYNAHQIFYSYPFTKTSYLAGKFLSAFSITFLISALAGVGMYVATLLPFANPELLGPNIFWNYAQGYVINIIPNMLLIGVIIFVVTTLSRSVYVGFAAVIALIIILGFVNSLAGSMDNKVMAALIDPSGMEAMSYYTKYWTISDYNTTNLPFNKWYIVNRAIWLGVALIFVLFLAKLFTFSEQGISFSFRSKKAGKRLTKPNFIGLFKIKLPKVTYDYSRKSFWSNVWSFTKFDFKYLIRNRVFLILILLGVLIMILEGSFANEIYGTKTYAVTRNVLFMISGAFEIFIIANTFLGAGILVHRGNISKMGELVDSAPTPNWVFYTSKFFALILMQITLLLVILVGGILMQAYFGYYHFEIGLYLQVLFTQKIFYYIIWAGLAMGVQSVFKNYIVGFFVLILFYLFGDKYSALGVEQAIFFFNKLPGLGYSDLNGFGAALPKYYIYVLYWLLFTVFVCGLTLLFWRRGIVSKLKDRFYFAKKRAKPMIVIPAIVAFIGFLGLGGYLYYENTILHKYYSAKENELMGVNHEKQYKKYQDLALPRIVDVKVDMDIYPKPRDFEAKGHYILENKSVTAVDTILVNFESDYINQIDIEGAQFLSKDTVYGYSFYRFDQPLDSGETAQMNFVVKNKPNTVLRNNSPVIGNGTFINNGILPGLGYRESMEITDTQLREKYHLPPKERMAEQTDNKARGNTYISDDADWITFETTVSTDEDQIAIAPGYLQKEWTENGRRYFHYSMGDQKILNFFAYNSGRYEVKKDKWDDINIEVYYNQAHPYNIDRMIKGVKEGLDYFTREFSPYQFKQVRIIEFPVTQGMFAQSFANTVPFSEGIGFIANVDEEGKNGVDYPFSVSAHELAHQWWAHQVIGANVQGATMLSESLAEYSSLKVLEHEYGKEQMRKFLKDALDRYLGGRGNESKKEKALMYNENQQYIHYNKGSMIFYALSDYLGEEKLNAALSRYIHKVAFQEPPYTVASELVEEIRSVTPDSLQYLIGDMFETITLYDNYIEEAQAKKLDNGQYEIDLKAIVSKYKSGEKGERIYSLQNGDSLVYKNKREKEVISLPLQDYIEVGVFAKSADEEVDDEPEKVLYLKKMKFTDIENDLKIIVDEKPDEVGIDPYNKLIDTRSYDNRKKVDFKKDNKDESERS